MLVHFSSPYQRKSFQNRSREFQFPLSGMTNAELLAELERLERKLHFLEAIIDELPTPIFVKNSAAEFCLLNKAMSSFFRYRGKS